MEKVVRIFSERKDIGNYIEYYPERDPRYKPVRLKDFVDRKDLTPKQKQIVEKCLEEDRKPTMKEKFILSGCFRDRITNDKNFSSKPAGNMVDVHIPASKSSMVYTVDVGFPSQELSIEIEIAPYLRTLEGQVVGYKLVAEATQLENENSPFYKERNAELLRQEKPKRLDLPEFNTPDRKPPKYKPFNPKKPEITLSEYEPFNPKKPEITPPEYEPFHPKKPKITPPEYEPFHPKKAKNHDVDKGFNR